MSATYVTAPCEHPPAPQVDPSSSQADADLIDSQFSNLQLFEDSDGDDDRELFMSQAVAFWLSAVQSESWLAAHSVFGKYTRSYERK